MSKVNGLFILGHVDTRNGGASKPVGFVTFLQVPHTFGQAIYMEDLYIESSYRGRGLGKRLILLLKQEAKLRGCNRLYWHTNHDNPARVLYDSVARLVPHVKYQIDL